MGLSVAYMGAVVGFVVGVFLQGNLFGQSSRAGYHAPNGKFQSKSDAVVDKFMFIGATTFAGYLFGPMVLGYVVANPLVGGAIVVGVLYLALHEEIDNWNSY